MNTSRDIEKLFEHFGGNADDYQEIGRENEARSARTRWPLLATLDFSQPPIPTVTEHRGVQLPRGFETASSADPAAGAPRPAATPIGRGKPPLFARAHRRSIPPVANVAIPATPLGASRFGELSDTAAPEITPAVAPIAPVVPAQAQPAHVQPPASPAFLAPAHFPRAAEPHPVAPAAARPQTAAPSAIAAPPAPSILGKLFAAPAAEPHAPHTAASGVSDAPLLSVFNRLRAAPASGQPETQTPARSWPATRMSRS